MKPIRNSIPIRELQTLLRQWRRRGLREAALLKVLELYLGLPDYMNAAGEYPVHFFYELSRSLKFHTVTMMLESVRLSESFGWVEGDNKLNVSSIFSPLWKVMDAPADLRANLQVCSNSYNINNNYPPEECPAELNPLEEGRCFFHEINANPAEKAEILSPLIA